LKVGKTFALPVDTDLVYEFAQEALFASLLRDRIAVAIRLFTAAPWCLRRPAIDEGEICSSHQTTNPA
jgi:hypothetical protein